MKQLWNDYLKGLRGEDGSPIAIAFAILGVFVALWVTILVLAAISWV